MSDYQLLGLNNQFVQGLEAIGVSNPTYAQSQFIPAVSSAGTSLIGVIKDFENFTEVYGLSLLNTIHPDSEAIQAVVLCNSRETCQQVGNILSGWGGALGGLKIVVLPGGVSIEDQTKQLALGAQIVVAYPGRLVDLVTRNVISLGVVRNVVLHGADELLAAGQRDALDIIMMAAEQRHAAWMLVSAVTEEVREFASRYIPKCREITVHDISLAGKGIRHEYYLSRAQHRFPALRRMVSVRAEWRGAIVCLTRNDGRELAEKISQYGHPTRFVDSEMPAAELNHIFRMYASDEVHWLTLTDVAVRNLALPKIPVILHYGVPAVPEAYYQRCLILDADRSEGAVSAALLTPKFEADFLDVCHKVQAKAENQPIPTPEELTEVRFKRSLSRLAAGGDRVLPASLEDFVQQHFGKLTKLELIKRVASAEYARLLEKGVRETDLNVGSDDVSPKPTEVPADVASQPIEGVAEGFVRLFINIGSMDGVTESTFLAHLERALSVPPAAVHHIDLKRTHIHFDVEAAFAPVIRAELPKFAVKDRAIRVDDAMPAKPEGRARYEFSGNRRSKRR